jgi:Tol biopolymer transport system component
MPENVFKPAIARSGNRLAYTQDFFDRDIWQVEPGKLPRSFVSSTRQEYNPQYSPDGKRVAFSSNRSGQMEIWVGDEAGGSLVQLTRFEEFSGSPQWSPDGQSIAFDRHMKTGWHIFVMASDGGQVRQLTSDDGDEVIPNWSRNGDSIYYASNRTGRYEIWRAPAKGGKGVQITRRGGWLPLNLVMAISFTTPRI